MEVHSHTHTARKKWTHYLWEFIMLFLAVFCGFLAENIREHSIEKKRARQFLQSMLLDVRTNIKNLDSLLHQDSNIIKTSDAMLKWLQADSATIDRKAFAQNMGAVWIRMFLVRKETYEQMKSSGSLRYVGNINFLKSMMEYDRIINFAMFRNLEFEKVYYQELFIPTLYKSYDIACQINLDTSNRANPYLMEKLEQHKDILTGEKAEVFRHDMGGALALRLERLRRSRDAYIDAKAACVEMERLIDKQLEK